MREQRCKVDLQKFDAQEMLELSKMLIAMRTLLARKGYKVWIKVKKQSPSPPVVHKNPAPVKL